MKDLGDTSFVLGIQIHRDRSQGILGLSQNSYIEKVFTMFYMKDCHPGYTFIVKGDKFSLSQCRNNEVEKKQIQKNPYTLAVENLMYAQVCTHLDLEFIIGMLGINPVVDH